MKENFVLERIQELCKRQKLSYYGLAKRAGIHQCTLSVLLNRNSTPNVYTLEKISRGLGVTLSQFFAEEEDRIELSDDQKMILRIWGGLSETERKLVLTYIDGMTSKK